MILSVRAINAIHFKGLLKWSFVFLTLAFGFFCLFQISLRGVGLYYFSHSNHVDHELDRYGISTKNMELEWRNFNPVLSLKNVKHESFHIESVIIELDFWDTLLTNKVVLNYVSINGCQLFLYRKPDIKPFTDSLGLTDFGAYLGTILAIPNLSLDLSIYNSPVRQVVAKTEVSLKSMFHNERQKIRAEVRYPGADTEPFVFMIDRLESGWLETDSDLLIQSYGAIELANFLPKISGGSIKVKQGKWRGSLEEGLGVLTLSFNGIETSVAGDEIEGKATIGFQGSDGALSGSIVDWTISDTNRILRFDPIWFDYQTSSYEQSKFPAFDAWISSQANEPDIRFFSEFLDLTELSRFVNEAFYGSEIVLSWISGLNLRGGLSEISGYLDRESGFGLSANLNIGHLDSHKGIPEMDNLSAQVYLYSNGFRFDIDASDAEVRFANVFDDKWLLEHLEGELDSWFNKNYFSLSNRGISAKLPTFSTVGQFSLSRPSKEKHRSLTLFFETDDLSVSDRDHYVPNNLPKALTTWLDSSIRTGYLEDVSFVYHGLIKSSEYINSKRSEFKAGYQNLSVKYDEDWPLVENAVGFLHLKGAQTEIGIDSASTLGVKNFSADLSVDNASLDLKADIDFWGEERNFLSFFLNSPLNDQLPFISEDWVSKGFIAGGLELSFPLSDFSLNEIDLSLNFQLDELDLFIPDYNLRFSSINGVGDFLLPHHLDGNFQGEFYGQNVLIRTASDRDSLDFLFDGMGSPYVVGSLLDIPVEEISDGTLTYFARMNFSVVDEVNSNFRLISDLTGLGINLPKPFDKEPLEERNFEIELEFLKDSELVSAFYGDHSLVLMLRNNHISAGALGFASKDIPSDLVGNQVYLTGSLEDFDIDEYLPYFGNYESFEIGWFMEDLKLKTLTYGDFSINDLTIGGTGNTHSYHFDISSPQLRGTVDFSLDETLVVDLTELELAIFEDGSPSEEAIRRPVGKNFFRYLPDLRFNVENLRFNDEKLGSWNFLMRQEKDQLEFYPLVFEMKGLGVSEGFLRWDLDTNKTYFNGVVLVDDLGATLSNWDFQPSIVAEATSIDVDLAWDGTPLEFDFLQLDGIANFELTKGRFIEITPAEGGMKLASLLNFSKIFGRISKFDFSDVRGEGLGFEKVNAKVDFQQGMVTFLEPMAVSSSSSRMTVGGSFNMIDRTFNNDLIVTLPVSESLPWYAAYLAVANPIAGLGVIVGQRVLRQPIEKFSSGKFQIRGSIENPEISFSGLWDQEVNIISPPNSEIVE